MSDKQYLFCYGSLRPDSGMRAAETYLNGSACLGKATIPGKLYEVSWFPGVKPISALEELDSYPEVVGYVFEVTESQLLQMDRYEGCPHLFVRERTVATLEDGSEVAIWVYYYNHSVRPEQQILSGDFLRKGEEAQAAKGGVL